MGNRFLRKTIVLLAALGSLCAQQLTIDVLQVKFYHDNASFEQAIITGNALLRQAEQLTPQSLTLLHRYVGLSHYNLGNMDSTRAHFISLLTLAPDAELDPVTVSPKIISFFNTVKSDFSALVHTPGNITYTRYVTRPDRRPGAGIRTLILPGWGQFHKGQPLKGMVLGGLAVGTLAGTLYSWQREADAHDTYLAVTIPAELNAAYRDYNSWHRRRQTFTVVTAVLWGLAVADALWMPYQHHPDISMGPDGHLRLGCAFSW